MLDLSVNTVAVHRANLMSALGVHKTAELVLFAVKKGLVLPDPLCFIVSIALFFFFFFFFCHRAIVYLWRCVCRWQSQARARAGAHLDPPHRRHQGRRRPLHPQQRRLREEVPAGNAGAGPAFFDIDKQRRQDLFLVNGSSWPGQPPGRDRVGFSAARRRHIVDVTDQGWVVVDLRHGRGRGDFDNDGWRTCSSRRSAAPVPQHRQGHIVEVTATRGPRQPGRLQPLGDVVRLRPRRLARPAGPQLRAWISRD